MKINMNELFNEMRKNKCYDILKSEAVTACVLETLDRKSEIDIVELVKSAENACIPIMKWLDSDDIKDFMNSNGISDDVRKKWENLIANYYFNDEFENKYFLSKEDNMELCNKIIIPFAIHNLLERICLSERIYDLSQDSTSADDAPVVKCEEVFFDDRSPESLYSSYDGEIYFLKTERNSPRLSNYFWKADVVKVTPTSIMAEIDRSACECWLKEHGLWNYEI